MLAFESIEGRHIYRETNGVIHRLAHLVRCFFMDDFWLDKTFSIIVDVLYEDCNGSRSSGVMFISNPHVIIT